MGEDFRQNHNFYLSPSPYRRNKAFRCPPLHRQQPAAPQSASARSTSTPSTFYDGSTWCLVDRRYPLCHSPPPSLADLLDVPSPVPAAPEEITIRPVVTHPPEYHTRAKLYRMLRFYDETRLPELWARAPECVLRKSSPIVLHVQS